jgi:hypothetical protein
MMAGADPDKNLARSPSNSCAGSKTQRCQQHLAPLKIRRCSAGPLQIATSRGRPPSVGLTAICMRAACSTVGANGIQERRCDYTMCVAPAILSNTNCTQLHWVCPIQCSVESVQITPSLVRKDLRPDLRIRLDLLSGAVLSRRNRGGSTRSARQRERVRTNLWAPPSEGIECRCISLCASIAQASAACDDCGRMTARPGASNCESRVKPLRST